MALFSFLLLLLGPALNAWGASLVLWRPTATLPPIVLAVPNGQQPAEAAEKFLHAISSDPELKNMFAQSPDLSAGKFRSIETVRFEHSVLLLGNAAADLQPGSDRVKRMATPFSRLKQSSYLLPPVYDLHIPHGERADLRQQIVSRFPFLVAMGGDDLDPRLYGDDVRGAHGFIPERDRAELSLIKDFLARGTGFIFAVCRGHQLLNVAMGARLIQDLPSEKPSNVNHAEGFHPIRLTKTVGNYLRSMIGQKSLSMTVNTFHHQAVRSPPRGTEVAALSPDGIIEGIEFKNGRGLSLQFHPEYMDGTWIAQKIFKGILQMKNAAIPRSCGSALVL